MKRIAQVLLVAASACNSGEVQPSAARATPPIGSATVALSTQSAATPGIAKGVPHGSQIAEVAVTEHGDAALTFDVRLGLRLWPTLDGTRPPVPVIADAPKALSIAHIPGSDDLLAVILDDAGGARILRLGRDGSLRDHASLQGPFLQAVAIEGGALVRTPDHAIEWYGADGSARGRVVADPGMQIRSVFTRNGRSAALIADAKTEVARTVQFLTLDNRLLWGARVELPEPVTQDFAALSPDHRRIAYDKINGQVGVFEIEPFPRTIQEAAPVLVRPDSAGIGFIDNEHVAVAGSGGDSIQLWSPAPHTETQPTPKNDPWLVGGQSIVGPMLVQPTESTHLIDGFAIADGMVVTGYGVALALDTIKQTRYLGWHALANGMLSTPTGHGMVMSMSTVRFVWLDDKLQVTSDVDLQTKPASSASWMYAVPVDEHHVLEQTAFEGKYTAHLVDVTTKASVPLDNIAEIDRMSYTPETGMIAIVDRHKVHRFKADLASNTVSKLPDIKLKGSIVDVRLYDPDKADGVTAIVTGWDSESANHQTLRTYREQGAPLRIGTFEEQVLGTDAAGTLYLFNPSKWTLDVMRASKIVSSLKIPFATMPAISADGSQLAFVRKNQIVLANATTGEELWHQPVWGPQQLLFTKDGSKIVLRATGGIATLDAKTGIRTALECGWNFGISDQPLADQPAGEDPVCEDPMLQ